MQQAGTRRGAAAAKLPPFLPKCDGQNSHCALPRRFVPPPSMITSKFPYYQLVVVYVPTVTVALPKNYFVRDMHPTKITPRDF